MKRKLYAVWLVVFLSGCGSNPALLNDQENDAIQKLRSGQYVLVGKQEYDTLRNINRYREFRDGGKTWRLDTATGAICLLLAQKYEWDDPEIARQGCFVSTPSK